MRVCGVGEGGGKQIIYQASGWQEILQAGRVRKVYTAVKAEFQQDTGGKS